MRPTALLLSLLLPAACATDFGLETLEPTPAAGEDPVDSATPEDSAPPEDSAAPVDTGTPAQEEEPTEPEPEEDPPAADDCDHTSDQVYAVSRDDAGLYLFHPDTLAFTRLGELDCTPWASPASMSVARDGHAFVRMSDDSVFRVDLQTLACTETAYDPRATGFGSFGMGHATNSADTWRDQLYVANDRQLARLDTSTWALEVLGRMDSQAELSGNAAGELWALLPLEEPAELVQLDHSTASPLRTLTLPAFPDPGGIDTFAFATWGGDFWLFVREYGMGRSTDVYQVTPEGKMSRVLEDVGFDVVGAGVSTWAPTE